MREVSRIRKEYGTLFLLFRITVKHLGVRYRGEEKDKKSVNGKDDNYDRMFFGNGKIGCGLILVVIPVVYIVYNIIVHS